MQENGKNIHISGIGGDVFGIDISGNGNVIGKSFAISEMVDLDGNMLKEVGQLTNHNIQKAQLSQIQESIN